MSTELCVLVVRGEEQQARSREVGCQWEEEDEKENEEVQRREVACQSDFVERRDAEVQVDLLTQQLVLTQPGSSAMLLQCLVRPDGPEGGALLEHCTTNHTRNRTRTRTVQPPVKLSPTLTQSRPRAIKRPAPVSSAPDQAANHSPQPRRGRQLPRRRRNSALNEEDQEEQQQQQQEEVEVEGEREEVVQQKVDREDPTWTPEQGAAEPCSPVSAAVDAQRTPLRVVKQELDGGGSVCCHVCGKVLKSRSSLARHAFIHTGQKPFACTLCPMRFNRRDNLRHHLAHLHPHGTTSRPHRRRAPQTWLCATCGKTFACRSRLRTHEVIHSGVKPHRCPLCPKAYMRTSDLEHHRRVVHLEGAEGGAGDGEEAPPPPSSSSSSSLLCHLCGREFRCHSQLASHLQAHSGERPHLCDACGRKFARRYQLRRHTLLVHGGGGEENRPPDADPAALQFPCPTCGRRLKSESQLAAHARLHSSERVRRRQQQAAPRPLSNATVRQGRSPAPFPCLICNKVFRFRSLLASHALVHSELRPHACDLCPRRFRRAAHLRRHRRAVHADGRRPPQSFVCGVCGLDKKCRSQLARHAIIHTGERPHACDLCPARFNRHGNLKQHQRRVHGVGPPPGEEGEGEEATPIVFEDVDGDDVISYKQEEMVAVVVIGEGVEPTPKVTI